MARKHQYQLIDLLSTSGWKVTGRRDQSITLEKKEWLINIGCNSTILYPKSGRLTSPFNTRDLDKIIDKLKELKLWAV
jgi:hypothetical protein